MQNDSFNTWRLVNKATAKQKKKGTFWSAENTYAIADHVKVTGYNIKWNHFKILASEKTDQHCKIKETLLIQELEETLNVNISSDKLLLY